ncbi:hapless 2 [Diorhabda sublineata]|uniref:hapless 2 n=1 Tax=Diorhabda sublineata TaxID=1163346 RepID=UPI0024E10FC9|nr:hapless 2 [Diorhabda sublineata]
MSKLFTLISYFFVLATSGDEINILSDDEKDLIKCCAFSSDCCDQKPTNFEVKAVLTQCRKPEPDFGKKNDMIIVREVRSGPCNEPNLDLTDCAKKMKISVKIQNVGLTNCKNQYILIDHVFDAVTGEKQKLFTPYILKITQKPIVEKYGLWYESMVNEEAKETVYNKNTPGYKGCDPKDTTISNCESIEYNNRVIPYSNGFCCPYKSENNVDSSKLSLISSECVNKTNPESNDVSNLQMRGNQDGDSSSNGATGHCLNYSNIWYLVYRLEKPFVQHELAFQIFQKYQTEMDWKWKDITKKIPIKIGTNIRAATNDDNTVIARYITSDINEVNFALNYKFHRILVPDISNVENADNYPEIAGGPEEYLVVKSNKIQSDGRICDVAGVGYEAFAKQPNRCGVPIGTCLKNQPLQMWREDKAKVSKGKRGDYFLKFFGALPEQPITAEGDNKTLRFFFTKPHTSTLKIEFKDDENSILRSDSLGIITEVYVDGSDTKKTTIIAKIFNAGLTSSVFYVALTECPLSLPASFSHIASMPVLIPPQRQHVYKLDIQCPLTEKSFFCSLLVLNTDKQLIAIRKIRLERSNRCICVWHCACACYYDDYNLKCDVLSLLAYHAAGFQGGTPIPVQIIEYSFVDHLLSMMLYIVLTLSLTFLLMGLVKALAGLCVVSVGVWGLDVILDLPRRIDRYYERDISHRRVRYNVHGWPVHPDTGVRVRNIPLHAEFCINVLFFIVYPFCVLHIFAKNGKFDSVRPEDIDSCYCKNGKSVKRKGSGLQSTLVKNK